MIPVTAFAGKRCALFGLGGSGLASARALVAGGADLIAWDDNPASVERAASEGIGTADLREADWSAFDALVLSPGVPLTHPEPHWTVRKAQAHAVPVIGDIELFCRQRALLAPDAPFVAITGTNGKSTTTALIAHILREAGRDVQMGGNIGVPVLDLEPPAPDRIHVVEVSSYQIDLAPGLDPGIGILLNLSPDHLDRHGSMENYALVKKQLVKKAGRAIVGVDDPWCASIANLIEKAGVAVTRISVATDRGAIDLSDAPSLRGEHNLQNALAALHACRMLGLTDAEIEAGMASFDGLAHRMQIVARHGRVLFVNDSKATNAEAAARSLASFGSIHWIAGGLPKEGGIASLAPFFDRIARVYLIGEAAPAFAATLGGRVPYEISATLDVAVNHAAADAAASDADEPVVLLAPAAASFDQFANFEKRGEAFVSAVDALEPHDVPRAAGGGA
ncbi:MAG: UDP-N-acetylmuramoyl-L-alanine--D-glutamate ligase [Roseitalea porphyridii]|jgi:UDP-N-acetylmuramoylalanine--D-glutamate ligase|uniref:UDP-N-acetylmuramoyl-L-alanine--D-glutamate ligase n=1 Tax=Roseitalea porphyridii TaxID=1852022 RepID=UPI0032ECB96E